MKGLLQILTKYVFDTFQKENATTEELKLASEIAFKIIEIDLDV